MVTDRQRVRHDGVAVIAVQNTHRAARDIPLFGKRGVVDDVAEVQHRLDVMPLEVLLYPARLRREDPVVFRRIRIALRVGQHDHGERAFRRRSGAA